MVAGARPATGDTSKISQLYQGTYHVTAAGRNVVEIGIYKNSNQHFSNNCHGGTVTVQLVIHTRHHV